jgi:hypothetical protein
LPGAIYNPLNHKAPPQAGETRQASPRGNTPRRWRSLARISVTRRTIGRIESINEISRTIMLVGLGKRVPVRGTRDEWDKLAENLNLMLDRIEALMGEVK